MSPFAWRGPIDELWDEQLFLVCGITRSGTIKRLIYRFSSQLVTRECCCSHKHPKLSLIFISLDNYHLFNALFFSLIHKFGMILLVTVTRFWEFFFFLAGHRAHVQSVLCDGSTFGERVAYHAVPHPFSRQFLQPSAHFANHERWRDLKQKLPSMSA